MTLPPIDPNKDATYQITLGSTFDEAPRQSFHGLKYNFKPAAIDYSLPGNLTSSEDGSGEVSLALPSTTDGEHHIFKGPLQETKANEYVLVYDPESNTFVLERLASMSRLAATRSSRANTLNGVVQTPNPIERPVESIRHSSKSNDDVPTISLDPVTSTVESIDISSPDEPVVPVLITPRLPPVSPTQSRHPHQNPPDPESSDDDSDIDVDLSKMGKAHPDEDVSDGDLDDLAQELESSLENRPGSSSSDAQSDDVVGPPRPKAPDFGHVPRSGGPISMSRFAGGRRREEEESSSSDDDDD